MAPTGTPAHAIERLNRSVNTFLLRPDIQDELMRLGYMPPSPPNQPQDLQALIQEETDRWTAILRTRNILPLH